MSKQPIGAYATVQWLDLEGNPEDGTEYSDVYFSFGQFEDDTDCDSFGVHDANIFYYAEDEVDLKRLKNSKYDFKVIDYELEYRDEQI